MSFDFDTSLTNDSQYPVLENIAVQCLERDRERTLKMERLGSFVRLQSTSGFANNTGLSSFMLNSKT